MKKSLLKMAGTALSTALLAMFLCACSQGENAVSQIPVTTPTAAPTSTPEPTHTPAPEFIEETTIYDEEFYSAYTYLTIDTNLRTDPDFYSDVIDVIGENTHLRILDDESWYEWLEVETEEGEKGWVYFNCVDSTDDAVVLAEKVKAYKNKEGLESEISFSKGDHVQLIEEDGDFWAVAVNGRKRFIHKELLMVCTPNALEKNFKKANVADDTVFNDEFGNTETIKSGEDIELMQLDGERAKIIYDGKIGYVPIDDLFNGAHGETICEVSILKRGEDGNTQLAVIPKGEKLIILSEIDDNYYTCKWGEYLGDVLSCYVKRTDKGEYTWESDANGFLRAYDADGNVLRNTTDFTDVKNSQFQAVVYLKNNITVLYTADKDGNFTVPVRIMCCSPGFGTPIGTYETWIKYRWLRMVGDTYAQWCTGIHGDYLFHSVPNWTEDAYDLEVEEFNYLGQTRSLGCIRLNCADARYLHDVLPLNFSVILTDESAPFEKPNGIKLDMDHTWDPTDELAYKTCIEKGCH
ncbi:MAG: SH3 domain-containing protein [Clostridia bacterium]|nr:SH3 domain-containing protein [Clostridia bacterium]